MATVDIRNVRKAFGSVEVLHGVSVDISDGEFVVLKPGRYVICAVSKVKIPVEALRYWNPALQEAYATPVEALARWKELHP